MTGKGNTQNVWAWICCICFRDDGTGDFELSINEEVLIPLGAAMRSSPLVTRRKDEVRGDVFVYVRLRSLSKLYGQCAWALCGAISQVY
jgi:hypothetical protein